MIKEREWRTMNKRKMPYMLIGTMIMLLGMVAMIMLSQEQNERG